jgi:hypothetical protein
MYKIIQSTILVLILIIAPFFTLFSSSDLSLYINHAQILEFISPLTGANIGGGLLIMLSLAIGYGVRKIYDRNRKNLNETQ